MKADNHIFFRFFAANVFWNVTGKRCVTSQKPAEKETIGICGYQPSTRNNLRIVSDFTSLKNFTFFKSSLSTKGQLVYKKSLEFSRSPSKPLFSWSRNAPPQKEPECVISKRRHYWRLAWGYDTSLIGIQEKVWLHMLWNIFAKPSLAKTRKRNVQFQAAVIGKNLFLIKQFRQ